MFSVSLVTCHELSKSYGVKPLFRELSISIFTGDRIGLIGPNGSGKSTLLKILIGTESPDSGEIIKKRELKIGYVPQICHFPAQKPEELLFEELQNTTILDYEKEALVQTWLNKLNFKNREITADLLSGGWKKRLAIAKELITSPDLLFLDEPTNHLDLEGIFWLEKFLARTNLTYLLVSHDRYFLQNVTNKIIEIDHSYPKGTFTIEGSYSYFLEKKEEFLKGQLERERSLASKARRELDWLRRSPQARTSKSKSRIDEAHELFHELSEVKQRNQQQSVGISFNASERESKKLLVAKNITKKIDDRTLFQHLDFTLSPGTRIGLVGPNGSGKTTLLRILADELLIDQGTIKKAENLKVVYFDQHRMQLPGHITLKEALSPNSDFVFYQGQSIHVNGWCKRFLFSPDLLNLSIEKLSGGERARVAISNLMLQPADLLLLDEPTNDLDISTLEILEESLLEFPGAVVLITHDRFMLDRICNLFLGFGNLDCTDLFANYSQLEFALKELEAKPKEKKRRPQVQVKQKLSYSEKKEYESIEGEIAKLEEQISTLNNLLLNPEIIENAKKLQEICTEIALKETKIEHLYLRWAELDQKL